MLEELVAQPHCIHVHVKSCNKICLNLTRRRFLVVLPYKGVAAILDM